jgi:hypothetical protein
VGKKKKKKKRDYKPMTSLGFDPRTFCVLSKRDNQLHQPAVCISTGVCSQVEIPSYFPVRESSFSHMEGH